MTTIKKQAFWSEPIGKVDLQAPAVVQSGTSIIDAVKEMKYNQIGCVLVLDAKKKLIGILSNGDLMHDFVGSTLSGDTPVDTIMTKDPASATSELTVQEALEIFHTHSFRHLPVLRGEVIEGILSVRGLMTFISEHLPLRVMNLPPDSSLIASRTAGE
jgi:CBS domain-containing protein